MSNEVSSISHRIIYSGWDFQQALSAVTFLMQECEYDKKCSHIDLRRLKCFETTLIVSFARPFKVGRGREELDLSLIGFEFSTEELELKNKMIRLRDKVVSHSDEEEMEYRTYSIKLFDDHDVRMPIARFREALYLEEDEIKKLEHLLHRLIYALSIYQFKIVQSCPDEFNKRKSPTSKQSN
ncbi:hypothetical protein [Aeromonas sp. FDAARGOS 1417]|uniref:hypothetical protein n=1 Tax=Aeromonas TaxID=642 RepID=UPI001C232A3E|nr:hypothetical protein [Aeromonas sp. FDAARGOS 1417]QWZ64894.1 hypothetical protein I6L47_03625 [Aeromonas sp. FDAARGOS 1417]